MKTLVIQSYRTHDVPSWIGRCMASVEAWAQLRGHDYRRTDDRAFDLCGDDYLAKVGANKRSITNLCRLELIRHALTEGYDHAVWVDADILVFAPDLLELPSTARIAFARETWVEPAKDGWGVMATLNNSVVLCPNGDPDLDFIIQATRHRAHHHPVRHNHQVGVELIRGLHRFLDFPLLTSVAMFSQHVVLALAERRLDLIGIQAAYEPAPVYAANLCASDDYFPRVSVAQAHMAMDLLQQTAGNIINSRRRLGGPPLHPAVSSA